MLSLSALLVSDSTSVDCSVISSAILVLFSSFVEGLSSVDELISSSLVLPPSSTAFVDGSSVGVFSEESFDAFSLSFSSIVDSSTFVSSVVALPSS